MSFWENRKVLITGHTGFKGTWLTLFLHSLGARLSGLALKPKTSPSFYEKLNLSNIIDDYFLDIRDIKNCKNVIETTKPEIIIHMAAQPLVIDSYLDPLNTYQTNVMGTINILEAARNKKSLKTIIIVTSDKCYHNTEMNYKYVETDSMGGHDPYSSSKGCAELVTSAYYSSFYKELNVCIASVRAGNVIGGGDWSNYRLIPDTIRSLHNKEDLNVRNPNAIRPWQHVLEPLYGYLILCEKGMNDPLKFSGGWNFGPNIESEQPVETIIKKVSDLWGDDSQWKTRGNNKFHEANILKLNSDKSKSLLGWQPKWSWELAVSNTVNWYKYFYENNEDLFNYSINQISSYIKD